jgi:tetratricopeptide (TPR) repeat protein
MPHIGRQLTMLAVAAATVAVGPCYVIAHESPEHVIESLTAEMERTGPSSELLYRRAVEHRAMRDWPAAEADLRAATQLAPEDASIHIELARVLVKDRNRAFEAALLIDGLQRKYFADPKPDFYADLIALEGELNLEFGAWKEAALAYDRAVELRPEVAWCVQRSRALSHLPEKRAEQLRGLRDVYTATQNPALLRELCDALLKADVSTVAEHREAATLIETELVANRFRSAWLIRRAKLHRIESRKAAATADLREALAELEPRIHPTRPDVELVVQRGAALAMLDEVAKARADLRRAEYLHVPDWMLAPLVEALAGRAAPTAVSPDE